MARPFRSFAIVPAAGRSMRMGQDKLLLPWGETTVIESLLAAWNASGVDEVVVVTRSDQNRLIAICNDAGASVVVPETPPPEMKHSVQAGLRELEATRSRDAHDAWLLAPADMPALNPAIIDRLLDEHEPQSPAILVPVYAEKRGHPVLFPWPFAEQVHSLADDEGVNALLQHNPVRKVLCDDGAIHHDLDTPEDYRRLRSAWQPDRKPPC